MKKLFMCVLFCLMCGVSGCIFYDYRYSKFEVLALPPQTGGWQVREVDIGNNDFTRRLKEDYIPSIFAAFRPESEEVKFPFFENALQIDSLFIEIPETGKILVSQPRKKKSRLSMDPSMRINIEGSAGCFKLLFSSWEWDTPTEIDSIIVQFPDCELNTSGRIVAEQYMGEHRRSLTVDELKGFLAEQEFLRPYVWLYFEEIKIPRQFKKIRLNFTIRVVNLFTSEVVDSQVVDLTLGRQDFKESSLGD